MMFLVVCALLTFAAVLSVLLPYMRGPGADTAEVVPPDANDLEVYKDQLREIDEDENRGAIGKEDANAARTEVSRRILKLSMSGEPPVTSSGNAHGRMVAVAVALIVPLTAWTTYTVTGSPAMPDQPFLARLETPSGQASIEVLIAKTEQHLTDNPNDAKGWEVIAPIYLRTGQFDKAANAFRRTSALNGPSVKGEIGLGEALAGMNDGVIGADALEAFKRAVDLAPNDPQPKIYLATALAQQGKFNEAKSAFSAILSSSPQDAPWRGIVERSIAQLETSMNAPVGQTTAGPTQADVENAAGMSDADRTAMIEGMVAGLDAKLTANPADKDGWLRLIRSYAMLKKPDAANAAVQRARLGLAGNDAALSEIKSLAREMGLETP